MRDLWLLELDYYDLGKVIPTGRTGLVNLYHCSWQKNFPNNFHLKTRKDEKKWHCGRAKQGFYSISSAQAEGHGSPQILACPDSICDILAHTLFVSCFRLVLSFFFLLRFLVCSIYARLVDMCTHHIGHISHLPKLFISCYKYCSNDLVKDRKTINNCSIITMFSINLFI